MSDATLAAANNRQAARIAELEVERDSFRAQSIELTADNYEANTKIEQLEAERDRLKAWFAKCDEPSVPDDTLVYVSIPASELRKIKATISPSPSGE